MPNCGRILILGGYGATGRCLSRLLVERCDADVTVAGRNENRAAALASQLGSRCRFAKVDATDRGALRRSMRGHDLVILAAPGEELPGLVAEAALDSQIDCLDVVYPASKLPRLRALDARARAEGRCLITEAGFHPGLPAALIRWAALQCDRLQAAEVASLIRPSFHPDDPMPESVGELVDGMFTTPMSEYADGIWRPLRWWEWPYRPFDFGPDWGTQPCVPLYFDELRLAQAACPELERTRFVMAGFGAVTDWVVTPLMWVLQTVARRSTREFCAQILWQSTTRFTPNPRGALLAIRFEGKPSGGFLLLHHENAYMFTAIPVVAFLKQWMDGSARPHGLHYMGMAADPIRLLNDMEELGISVSTTFVTSAAHSV